MLIEDFATGDRCTVATDLDFTPGQHVVVDGRRWVVVAGDDPPPRRGRWRST